MTDAYETRLCSTPRRATSPPGARPPADVRAWFVRFAFGAVSVLAAACGGGGDRGDDTAAMTLQGSSPAQGAVDVEPDAALSLTFSSPLAPVTPSDTGSSLVDGAGHAVPFDATVAGASLSVTPRTRLALASRYTVTAQRSLRGAGGEALAQPVAVGFTTRDGRWATAQPVGGDSGEQRFVEAARDGAGNVVVVWEQRSGDRYGIWAARHMRGGTIEAARQISADNGTRVVMRPSVAVDAAGNALVVWDQFDGTHFQLWFNRYAVGSGWDEPRRIEPLDLQDAFVARVAMDAQGTAWAVWAQRDATGTRIRASRYRAGLGWEASQSLGGGVAAGANAGQARIAVGATGDVVAVWVQDDGVQRLNIWSRRFTPASGWGPATRLHDDTGGAEHPQVGMDAAGRALAVWRRADGAGRWRIWASRGGSAGWGDAVPLESDADAGESLLPRLATDASGGAMAAWVRWTPGSDGQRFSRIVVSRHRPDAGWEPAQAIDTAPGSALTAAIGLDAAGHALVLYDVTAGGLGRVHAKRQRAQEGWGEARPVDTGTSSEARFVALSVDAASGEALALWSQRVAGESDRLWMARLD